MILSISGNQMVESETDLILVNKLNEVISEVNNIEAKLQSTSSTNTEREEICPFCAGTGNENHWVGAGKEKPCNHCHGEGKRSPVS